jgi:hypothetical protein
MWKIHSLCFIAPILNNEVVWFTQHLTNKFLEVDSLSWHMNAAVGFSNYWLLPQNQARTILPEVTAICQSIF